MLFIVEPFGPGVRGAIVVLPPFNGDSPDLPYTSTTGITAGSSGSPYVLTTNLNTVSTSTSTNNYIKLNSVSVGVPQFITNFTANILNVLPPTGDAIDQLSANTAVQLGIGGTIQLVKDVTGRYISASLS